MTEKTISIDLGNRSYDVLVGCRLMANAGQLIRPHLARPWTVIVTDENVGKAQSAKLKDSLDASGIEWRAIVLPAGEQTKSFANLEKLLRQLVDLGVERNDAIIALGGGVIGDLVGFAAGILRRGCKFIQIPTSLLAQVDSSVGGKTAINIPEGKNLIGLFNQPELVIADVEALETLPRRELRAGMAEVIKYSAIDDAAFFEWLENNMDGIISLDQSLLIEAIAKCVSAKARIVEEDEREHSKRALLNLGHTFGHALEAMTGYSNSLLHGEAVAAGMGLAFDYSVKNDICPSADAIRLKELVKRTGLPDSLSAIKALPSPKASDILRAMQQDKKVESGEITLILVEGIGKARVVRKVPAGGIESFLVAAGALAN